MIGPENKFLSRVRINHDDGIEYNDFDSRPPTPDFSEPWIPWIFRRLRIPVSCYEGFSLNFFLMMFLPYIQNILEKNEMTTGSTINKRARLKIIHDITTR